MTSSPTIVTSSRPVVGVLRELVMQFAVAVIVDRAGGSERLDADLFDLGAGGACRSAPSHRVNGRARHARGSSPRLGDDHRDGGGASRSLLSACWLAPSTS